MTTYGEMIATIDRQIADLVGTRARTPIGTLDMPLERGKAGEVLRLKAWRDRLRLYPASAEYRGE